MLIVEQVSLRESSGSMILRDPIIMLLIYECLPARSDRCEFDDQEEELEIVVAAD